MSGSDKDRRPEGPEEGAQADNAEAVAPGSVAEPADLGDESDGSWDDADVLFVPASSIDRDIPAIYDNDYLDRVYSFSFEKAGLTKKVVDKVMPQEGRRLLSVIGEAMRECLVEAKLILPIQGSTRVTDEVSKFIRKKLDMASTRFLADGGDLQEASPEYFVDNYLLKEDGFETPYLRSLLENAYLVNVHHDERFKSRRKLAEVRSSFGEQVSNLSQDKEAAEQAAKVDSLTGLPNRRWLTEYFETLKSSESKETAGKFAVIMLDGDKFKSVNDRWGHAAGDVVLKNIARILQEQGWDIVARIGGEEFVMVKRVDDDADLAELGEQVRAAVAAEEMHFTSSIGETAGQEIRHHQTVSVGVAAGDLDDLTNWKLVEQADAASFNSKAIGRDKVTVFEEGVQYATPEVDESR